MIRYTEDGTKVDRRTDGRRSAHGRLILYWHANVGKDELADALDAALARAVAAEAHHAEWAILHQKEVDDAHRSRMAAEAREAKLREALQWYADGKHLFGSLPDDWDECSDHETAGWLWPCEPVDEQSWGVEDGYAARSALTEGK